MLLLMSSSLSRQIWRRKQANHELRVIYIRITKRRPLERVSRMQTGNEFIPRLAPAAAIKLGGPV